MAKTCPSCGYSPIGPFTDNCPICAEPVRSVSSDAARGGGAADPMKWPPLLIGGWVVIGLVMAYLFWGDWLWLLLNLGLCGAAWWAVAMGPTLLLRLLGGSLLALFIPGIWLAAQPGILPGLDQREMTPERFMKDIMAVAQGTSPDALRMSARMKTISAIIYAMHAVIVVPLTLLVPPFLDYRQRRRLGGPIWFSKPQAIVGLVVWLVLVPGLVWLTAPVMQSWTEKPKNALDITWPRGQWPPQVPPDDADDEPE
jgi:hypothetical protein